MLHLLLCFQVRRDFTRRVTSETRMNHRSNLFCSEVSGFTEDLAI